jgi:hypothetical protein
VAESVNGNVCITALLGSRVRTPLTVHCSSFLFVVCLVGSRFGDELITRSEGSNRLCVSVSDLQSSTMRRLSDLTF